MKLRMPWVPLVLSVEEPSILYLRIGFPTSRPVKTPDRWCLSVTQVLVCGMLLDVVENFLVLIHWILGHEICSRLLHSVLEVGRFTHLKDRRTIRFNVGHGVLIPSIRRSWARSSIQNSGSGTRIVAP